MIDNIAEMNEFKKYVYEKLSGMSRAGNVPNTLLLDYLGSDHGRWLADDRIFRGAPHMVTVSCARDALTGIPDCHIYLSCLEMFAWSLDYGTLWLGFMDEMLGFMPDVRQLLGIPDNHEIGYPMLLGKSKVSYARGIERRQANIHVVRTDAATRS